MATLDAQGTDPAVAAAVSELVYLGYVIAPDGESVRRSDRGFLAIQGGDYRS
jgi:hypothetical protein